MSVPRNPDDTGFQSDYEKGQVIRTQQRRTTGFLWREISGERGHRGVLSWRWIGPSQHGKGGSYSFQLDPGIPSLSLGRKGNRAEELGHRLRASEKAQGRAGEGVCI